MKIVFLNFYSGLIVRGGEVFVHEVAGRLAAHQDVTVFQAGPKQKAAYDTEVIGNYKRNKLFSSLPTTHPIRRLFLDTQRLKELFFTLQTLPKLIKSRPDVIISINSGWQALICSIYSRVAGAKLVIIGHSGPGWDDRWNLLMKPHLFIALTKHQSNWAKKATIWKQAFAQIPDGVDLTKFTHAGKKFHTNLKKPIILMIAASSPDKRVEQGIRAVASLPTGSLLLIGTGPLDERVNKLGYELLGGKRFFHTTVSREDVPNYYRSANIFTLCSKSSEAFGIVYLEAMASGLACVATDDESRREIVGNAGVFVKDPDNEKEYSEAIKKALAKDWGSIPREQAQKYSWDEVAHQYEKIL